MNYEEDLIKQQLLKENFEEFIANTKLKYIEKNSKFSETLRQKGNGLYVRDHNAEIHKQIFNYYSMSIAYAPEASEELALAYGNRSALLLHFKKYKETLEDINRALNITKSNSVKVKLLCRKVECLTVADLSGNDIAFKEAVKYFDSIEDDDVKRTLANKIQNSQRILGVNKPKIIIKKDANKSEITKTILEKEKHGFDFVDMKYSKKYGKHLIAAKNFKPGEIIYVEEPYAICSNIKTSYTYCCHCLATVWASIPCKHCNWCVFCSIECRRKAWSTYHKIECSVIPHIKNLQKNFVHSFRLSLRIIMNGIQEFGGIDQLKAEVEKNNKSEDEYLKDEKFSNSFKSIYNLSDNVSNEQLKINVRGIAIVLTCVDKYTSFFKSNYLNNPEFKNLAQNKQVLFIGTLLLRLINISCTNRHRILNSLQVCKNTTEPFKCMVNECCSKGVCLAPVSSLINNSCIPNVKRCFSENGKIIIYAVETIYKNSQIFDSYLCNFYDTSKLYRNPILKKQYNLTCNCVACERNWPALFNKVHDEKKFIETQRNFFENKFIQEHKQILLSIQNKNTKYNIKIIHDLQEIIEKAIQVLIQPCPIRCILTFSLQKVFENLFGYNIETFDTCPKNVIMKVNS